MDRFTVPIEWKAAGDGTLEGYASTFGNVDLGADVVEKGAFKGTIGDIKANGIPLLADHVASTSSVLGTIYDANEDDKGLLIKARFSQAPSAQDVRTKLLEGHLNSLSIGYEPTKFSFEERDGNTVRLLQEVKLWETSVVVFPMNPEAAVSRVKSLSEEERKALATALAEAEAELEDTDSSAAGGDGEEAEARHAEAEEETGSQPEPVKASWDHWTSEAILAGHDPSEKASAADLAGARAQLELTEAALGLPTTRED